MLTSNMPTSAESIAQLIGIILVFILVLTACYFTTRFVAGKQMVQKKMGNFEVVETFMLAQNKYLQLLRMGNRYIVISVTKDNVNVITELEESEVCHMKLDAAAQGKSFKEIFSSFTREKITKEK